jgi:hypothetical protein
MKLRDVVGRWFMVWQVETLLRMAFATFNPRGGPNAFVSTSFICLQYHDLSMHFPPLILVAGKIPIAALAGRPSTAKPSTQIPIAMQKHYTQYTRSRRSSHKIQNMPRKHKISQHKQ